MQGFVSDEDPSLAFLDEDQLEEEAKAGPEWARVRRYIDGLGMMRQDGQLFYWGDTDPRELPFFFITLGDNKTFLAGCQENFDVEELEDEKRRELEQRLETLAAEFNAVVDVEIEIDTDSEYSIDLYVSRTFKLKDWTPHALGVAMGNSEAVIRIMSQAAQAVRSVDS